MDAELDVDGIECEPGSQEDFMFQGAALHQILTDCVNDSRVVSKMQVNIGLPSSLLHIELDIEAPGIKTAF